MTVRRPPGFVRKQPEDSGKTQKDEKRPPSPERRSADDDLREHLQSLLDLDVNLRSYGLKADVVDGEAQISGVVDSLAEKEYARELARSVPGIRKVADRISISTDGPITDRDVEFEVTEELQATPGIDIREIGAKSAGGHVFLVGRTSDETVVESAKKAASKARGVTRVTSRVKPGKKSPAPGTFHAQVRTDRPRDRRDEPGDA